jgi:5-methylcytosine-specific restriction endonuclease McrA
MANPFGLPKINAPKIDLGIGSNKRENIREPVSKSQKNEVLARQKSKCTRCHKLLDPRAMHFDHIKEVYKGGKSTIANLQALCANCHNIKTHEDKLKKVESKRKKTSKEDNNPFGLPKFNQKSFDFGV